MKKVAFALTSSLIVALCLGGCSASSDFDREITHGDVTYSVSSEWLEKEASGSDGSSYARNFEVDENTTLSVSIDENSPWDDAFDSYVKGREYLEESSVVESVIWKEIAEDESVVNGAQCVSHKYNYCYTTTEGKTFEFFVDEVVYYYPDLYVEFSAISKEGFSNIGFFEELQSTIEIEH